MNNKFNNPLDRKRSKNHQRAKERPNKSRNRPKRSRNRPKPRPDDVREVFEDQSDEVINKALRSAYFIRFGNNPAVERATSLEELWEAVETKIRQRTRTMVISEPGWDKEDQHHEFRNIFICLVEAEIDRHKGN